MRVDIAESWDWFNVATVALLALSNKQSIDFT